MAAKISKREDTAAARSRAAIEQAHQQQALRAACFDEGQFLRESLVKGKRPTKTDRQKLHIAIARMDSLLANLQTLAAMRGPLRATDIADARQSLMVGARCKLARQGNTGMMVVVDDRESV